MVEDKSQKSQEESRASALAQRVDARDEGDRIEALVAKRESKEPVFSWDIFPALLLERSRATIEGSAKPIVSAPLLTCSRRDRSGSLFSSVFCGFLAIC